MMFRSTVEDITSLIQFYLRRCSVFADCFHSYHHLLARTVYRYFVGLPQQQQQQQQQQQNLQNFVSTLLIIKEESPD